MDTKRDDAARTDAARGDASGEIAAPMDVGAATPPTPRGRSSSPLATVLALVVCAAVGGVVALAMRARTDEDGSQRTTPPASLPSWQRAGGPAAGPGPRGTGNAANALCGALDPEVPAVIEIELESTARDGPVLDFGVVRQAIEETVRVPFRSAGPGPLCIHNLTSACSCYKLQLEDPAKRRYEPGTSGALLITLDSTRQIGNLAKKVMVHTNARARPTLVITCRSHVGEGLVLMERSARFPPVPSGVTSEVVLTLYAPKSEAPFNVTGIEAGRAMADGTKATYELQVTPVEDPLLHKVAVRITSPGRSSKGAWRDELLLHTTHPNRPQVAVRAYGQVVDRIVTRARQVTLGHVGRGRANAPAIVRFQPGGAGLRFRLLEATVEPRAGQTAPAGGLGFKAEVGSDDEGWFVRVSYDGRSRAAGALEATLMVRTDDAAQPSIQLPIRATVRQ